MVLYKTNIAHGTYRPTVQSRRRNAVELTQSRFAFRRDISRTEKASLFRHPMSALDAEHLRE
ncbi:MAG TPA: hypothetical protein DIW81_02555 [Planctomycetaceae bacterium]|nr:hypothetical protein [Planctomycetaceae bacterium]